MRLGNYWYVGSIMILAFGAIFGLIAVLFGAYAEHGLRQSITEEQFRFLMTAIRYNQIHAVVVISIGFALFGFEIFSKNKLLKSCGIIFLLGTMLFSFSIYLSVTFQLEQLLKLAPIGGITIMIGWLLLCISGILATKNQTNEQIHSKV